MPGSLKLWDGSTWRYVAVSGPKGDKGDQGDPGADGSPDTAAEVLAKLITVDGAGSGLDADKLDGAEGSAYVTKVGTGTLHVEWDEQIDLYGHDFVTARNDDGSTLLVDTNYVYITDAAGGYVSAELGSAFMKGASGPGIEVIPDGSSVCPTSSAYTDIGQPTRRYKDLFLSGTVNLAGTPLGSAATKDVGTTAGTVAAGDDSRFTDSRPPTGAAGGVLGGTYPNPTFAADMATQAELDAEAVLARNADNLTSGTVADARIASTIARDSEVTAAIATAALKANNLSDLADAGSARWNISSPVPAPAAAVSVTNVASLSGTPTIDGIGLAAGDRVLLVGQTTANQNGLWVAAAGAWTRPTDYPSGGFVAGRTVAVRAGTAFGNTLWQMGQYLAATIDAAGSGGATTWRLIGGPAYQRSQPFVVPAATGLYSSVGGNTTNAALTVGTESAIPISFSYVPGPVTKLAIVVQATVASSVVRVGAHLDANNGQYAYPGALIAECNATFSGSAATGKVEQTITGWTPIPGLVYWLHAVSQTAGANLIRVNAPSYSLLFTDPGATVSVSGYAQTGVTGALGSFTSAVGSALQAIKVWALF